MFYFRYPKNYVIAGRTTVPLPGAEGVEPAWHSRDPLARSRARSPVPARPFPTVASTSLARPAAGSSQTGRSRPAAGPSLSIVKIFKTLSLTAIGSMMRFAGGHHSASVSEAVHARDATFLPQVSLGAWSSCPTPATCTYDQPPYQSTIHQRLMAVVSLGQVKHRRSRLIVPQPSASLKTLYVQGALLQPDVLMRSRASIIIVSQ